MTTSRDRRHQQETLIPGRQIRRVARRPNHATQVATRATLAAAITWWIN
jgi:hypothetical protein